VLLINQVKRSVADVVNDSEEFLDFWSIEVNLLHEAGQVKVILTLEWEPRGPSTRLVGFMWVA
jgi:hypothetical protein